MVKSSACAGHTTVSFQFEFGSLEIVCLNFKVALTTRFITIAKMYIKTRKGKYFITLIDTTKKKNNLIGFVQFSLVCENGAADT